MQPMKLDRKKMLLISFMLFSLFFGAGNSRLF